EFQTLIDELESLPHIGEKTAERLANHIFEFNEKDRQALVKAILEINNLKTCKRCFNLASRDLCAICEDKNRKNSVLAVVETPLHIAPLERAGYRGVYHVLGGLIASFLHDPNELHLKELLKRIEQDEIKEVILALDNSLEGETTAMYVIKEVKNQKSKVKISRLAQGLSTGSNLEYADETTVREALRGRREI
ncbi:MAG: recombination mediator RecR, partial [Patescibacteria group bacterium]|nr:recombination mediator RecR [Patescibacteria group bacterium]